MTRNRKTARNRDAAARRRTARKTSQRRNEASRDTYVAHTYQDLLNALPTFFGFVPRESVMAMCVTGPRNRFGFKLRHDLPAPEDVRSLATMLASHLVGNEGDGYFLFAVSRDAERARTMVLALQDALPRERCRLAIWADDCTVFSDTPGYPVQGEPYVMSDHHEARVRAIASGQVVLGDRSEVALEVATITGDRRRRLDAEHGRVLDDFLCRLRHQDPEDFEEFQAAELIDLWQLTDRAFDGQSLSDAELVELAVRCSPTPVRDSFWYEIDRQNGQQWHSLWTAVARVAAPEFAPAALSLAGFAAWQWGDGARALVAAERALELEPEYLMAQILAQILADGLHPGTWSARHEFT